MNVQTIRAVMLLMMFAIVTCVPVSCSREMGHGQSRAASQ